MVGIYIIKNKINDLVYIGQSIHIERRWKEHLHAAHGTPKLSVDKAMKELGLDNFYLEIIEQCDVKELDEREQYYINSFDSWHNGYNGFNYYIAQRGEDNINAKLTEKEVEQIRIEQSLMQKNRREIFEKYKDRITWTNFLYVCKYITWPLIRQDLNIPTVMEWHRKQLGNEARKFSMEDLEQIVKLKYQEHWTNVKIADLYNKHPKTISRIFTGYYYGNEMKLLKETKPELFQHKSSTTIN